MLDETTAEHVARHERIIRELQGLRNLRPRVADALVARTLPGFKHHGEFAHHAPNFRPLHEGFEEETDKIDLTCVHTRERVELGIAEPLPAGEASTLFAEYEYHAVQAANYLADLLDLLEARDE